MAKKDQNFEMFAGDSKLIQITVTDENGNPKNLTGAIIKWNLRKVGSTLITKTSPANISITDAANGIFIVTLDPSDTQTFISGDYKHQAEVTDSTGTVELVTDGTATINDSLFN